jgi:hypothetical protein
VAPPRPYSRLRWAATRVLALVAEDGYSTDEALADSLGLPLAEIRTIVGVLYRQRRIDRAYGYLVLPACQLAELEAA